MKHSVTLILLALIVQLLLASSGVAQDQDNTETPATIVKIKRAFSNLPRKVRQDYKWKLVKVESLLAQKRIFDALEKIDELNKIFPDHPSALNSRGICYVELRAFKKAIAIFKQLLKSEPNNTTVHFNLAEMDFVTRNWASAHDRFAKLILLLPPANKSMIRLCEFKLLLCRLKTDRIKEAVALRDKYDTWDDSPFYYYSRAAICYSGGEKRKAAKLLHDVRYIWDDNAALATWHDTLIEFGYIRSFYGMDVEEE